MSYLDAGKDNFGQNWWNLLRSWEKHRESLMERAGIFMLFIIGDLAVLGGLILWIILKYGKLGKAAVKIDGHRYYKRERRFLTSKRKQTKGVLFMFLLLQSHLGALGQGASLDRRTLEENMDNEDYSLMARAESTWQPPAMPSQNTELPEQGQGQIRDGFSDEERAIDRTERRSDSDRGRSDRFYQIAIIFPLFGATVSAKVDWDDYWITHRQVANLIGSTVDELIAIHHVAHLPVDLHELEAHALIPQRLEEVCQGQSKVATLVDVEYHRREEHQTIQTRRKARMMPKQITRRGLLRALLLKEECEQDRDCLVWRNNDLWTKQNVEILELYHGDYLRIAIPPREEECDDSMHLMQNSRAIQTRSRSRDTPNSAYETTATIFAYGSDEIDLDATSSSNIDTINALIEIWGFTRDEIMALHIVSEPPIWLQRRHHGVYILAQWANLAERTFEEDVLVLTEVVVSDTHSNFKRNFRKVVWMRNRYRRIQILAFLRADWMCDQEDEQECVVLFNNVIWHHDDNSLRHLEDGDYVKVDIFVKKTNSMEFVHRIHSAEEKELQRRFFLNEPQAGSAFNDEQNGTEPSLPASCEALSSVEDATRDFAEAGEGQDGHVEWQEEKKNTTSYREMLERWWSA